MVLKSNIWVEAFVSSVLEMLSISATCSSGLCYLFSQKLYIFFNLILSFSCTARQRWTEIGG